VGIRRRCPLGSRPGPSLARSIFRALDRIDWGKHLFEYLFNYELCFSRERSTAKRLNLSPRLPALATPPSGFLADPLLRRRPRTDRTAREVVPLGRAVLSTEVDDLQVKTIPKSLREDGLQVSLRPLDTGSVREAPPRGESMDVRIDRKRWHTEGLGHDDTRGLVSDARQTLERLETLWDLSTMIVDDRLRQLLKVLRLRRRQTAGLDLL